MIDVPFVTDVCHLDLMRHIQYVLPRRVGNRPAYLIAYVNVVDEAVAYQRVLVIVALSHVL